ncbi:MAG: aminoglycoside phosphotransferase family protein [Ferruginibacter sp.]
MQSVLEAYGFDANIASVEQYGSGLINNTWKITSNAGEYILQKINESVFKEPFSIAHNISFIGSYLKKNHPEYTFIAPIVSKDGKEIIYLKGEGYFRMFPFVSGSYSLDTVQTREQAFEAARQFGRFTKLLAGINMDETKITVPHFHDLSLRYHQFVSALKNGNKQRIAESVDLVQDLQSFSGIVDEFERLKNNPAFKLRVTHHDTKISNVLFDSDGKGLCVIDLDTVMPGYFISDIGDMMRTYLSPVSENETDFSKIEIREDFYKAIVRGYYTEMKDELTNTEKEYFFYAGKFIIYMQALRFLTDYLMNDVYYSTGYPMQNFMRAKNQCTLLQKMVEKEYALKGFFE